MGALVTEQWSNPRQNWTIQWEQLSHKGMVRKNNQDFVDSYRPDDPDSYSLFLVADGMGGHVAGEVASQTAVESIMQEFAQRSDTDDRNRLLASFLKGNETVHHLAKSNPDYDGMGTTCVALLLREGLATIAHVGDSRAYLIRDGNIQQITRDHSPVWEMVEKGAISKEEARVHPARSMISRSLGFEAEVNPELHTPSIKCQGDDIFLLCTDGLNTKLDDPDLLRIVLKHSSLAEACRELVRVANKRGGDDNVSVQLIKMIRQGDGVENHLGKRRYGIYFSVILLLLLLILTLLMFL
jgi:protein phosphatase